MNVLLVAPDSGMAGVVAEVRAVSIALHPVVLSGNVTRKDVLDSLAGHVWDIIWFATHGTPDGIMLTDGPVPIADLTAIARNSGARLIVLNSCSSRYIGLELHYELGIDVVTTEAPANDLTAYQTGTFMARNLAAGMSIDDAFKQSRPGQNALYYLFTSHQDSEDIEARTIKLLNDGFNRLERMIRALETSMNDQNAAMDRRVVKVETSTAVLERRTTPVIDRVMILVMTAIMVAMFMYNIVWAAQ